MTVEDIVIGALCAWRENRGGGLIGMQSVINVLVNRAKARRTSVYVEAIRQKQFSSMTAKDDPELTLFPMEDDVQFHDALNLMQQADKGLLQDLTKGSTQYVTCLLAESETRPLWVKQMQDQNKQTVIIANQVFFRA
jgi:hypothetical protein